MTFRLGYERVPEPGSHRGPCLRKRCGHARCDELRDRVRKLCRLCEEPIGYERLHASPGRDGKSEHWSCVVAASVTMETRR